jgi:AraC-like DNA-binding protein
MPLESHFRYLPVLDAQRQWGFFLIDCGYTEIRPGMPYPPQRHPAAYDFDWGKGRTLDEYQIVYITRGRGVFEGKGVRRQMIEAGDAFVLFPGVWHRYAPDPKTGWDEQWIGFNGALAERLLSAPFFSPSKPVLRIGADEALRQCFIALVDAVERNPAGTPYSNAGQIVRILGLIQERVQCVGANGRGKDVVYEAQNRILQQATRPIDFAALAREFGVSYTAFRRAFKRQTGVAPAQYQNTIRINRARDLLAATGLTVSEIATQTGFDTVFYFSRAFKKKTGLTPSAYRARAASGRRLKGDAIAIH